MPTRETRPPKWGPAYDPAPWPPWDPIPWPWKRVPFPDPGDPIPFPFQILEKIRVEDVIALRRVRLEAFRKVFEAQFEAEASLLEEEMAILKKYK